MDSLLATYLLSVLVCSCTGSVLLLGGQFESGWNHLNPYLARVQGYGSCGYFNPGVPDLPHGNTQFGSAIMNNIIFVCGGYNGRLGATKNCYFLDLEAENLAWAEFPSLLHGRHDHSMVVVGEDLFVLGGHRSSVAPDFTIEKYNWSAGLWEKVAELENRDRNSFCSLPWGSDGIVLVGGHSKGNFIELRKNDIFNTTDHTWSKIADLKVGRYEHACAWYNGSIVTAGGLTLENETPTVEMYDIEEDAWSYLPRMQVAKESFALGSFSGQLAAYGGHENVDGVGVVYLDTVEVLDGDQYEWQPEEGTLDQGISGHGLVDVGDRFADIECQSK